MTSPLMTPLEKSARAIGYVMASIVSGNNMPCMSGDPRDRLSPLQRQHFDRACDEAVIAAFATLEPDEEMLAAMNELAGTINPADCWNAAMAVVLRKGV